MLDQMSVVEEKKEIPLSCLATFSLVAVYNAGMAVLEKCDWLGISYFVFRVKPFDHAFETILLNSINW